MGNIKRDPAMSQRVSAHFKIDIVVGRDDQEKMYCVLNHNNFPAVWFRAFNAEAKRNIYKHIELRRFKHKMAKPEKASVLTQRERDRRFKEAAEYGADVYKTLGSIRVGYEPSRV